MASSQLDRDVRGTSPAADARTTVGTVTTARGVSSARKLLTLETGYCLETIRALRMEHEVTCRDLDGFFAHVWTVHPAIGANPDHPRASAVGRPRRFTVSSRHTVIEGTVARFGWLERLPRVNFALAQIVLFVRLLRVIRREGVTLVRACDPFYTGVLGLLLARASGVPLVIRVNANQDLMYEATGEPAYPRLIPSRRLEQRVARFVLRRADLVAAGNQNNRGFALANGASYERSTVFRCGTWVDPVHFETDPAARPSVRDELGLGTRPFIVVVSRLEPVKFPEDVLTVVAEVRTEHPDVAAVFVGDGTMRRQLERLAVEMGLADHVRFAGNRDQEWVAAALASASVVLSPLAGRALVEACLSGTPVVAYDVEWHSELIVTGETGILVPYRDTYAMAEAVRELLSAPSFAASVGSRGRAVALKMMDPALLREHERREYRRLIEATQP